MADLRELLTGMIGEWSGTYRLWLEPEVLHSESAGRGLVRPLLGERFVVHHYHWEESGTPQEGSMLIGCPGEGLLQASWVDSWHNGDAIMFCTGGSGPEVTGEYGPADQRWRWRTVFEMPSTDDLVITAWNISPGGEEAKATETVYRRTR